MKLGNADAKIAVGEFVRNVKPERSEFSSFQADTVEEAEGEEKVFEDRDLLGVRVEEVAELRHLTEVSSEQVGLE